MSEVESNNPVFIMSKLDSSSDPVTKIINGTKDIETRASSIPKEKLNDKYGEKELSEFTFDFVVWEDYDANLVTGPKTIIWKDGIIEQQDDITDDKFGDKLNPYTIDIPNYYSFYANDQELNDLFKGIMKIIFTGDKTYADNQDNVLSFIKETEIVTNEILINEIHKIYYGDANAYESKKNERKDILKNLDFLPTFLEACKNSNTETLKKIFKKSYRHVKEMNHYGTIKFDQSVAIGEKYINDEKIVDDIVIEGYEDKKKLGFPIEDENSFFYQRNLELIKKNKLHGYVISERPTKLTKKHTLNGTFPQIQGAFHYRKTEASGGKMRKSRRRRRRGRSTRRRKSSRKSRRRRKA